MPLVITRRRGDCVVIGEGAGRVVLVVVDARHGAATLAVEAPTAIVVTRGELVGEPRRVVTRAAASSGPARRRGRVAR